MPERWLLQGYGKSTHWLSDLEPLRCVVWSLLMQGGVNVLPCLYRVEAMNSIRLSGCKEQS